MVENRWNPDDARAAADATGEDPEATRLALALYASRLVGADPALVSHGGGNSSVKTRERDLFGRRIDVLHVKASGCDLGDLTARFMPGLRLAPLLELRALESLSDEDMVNALRGNLIDSTAPTPSVETLLHAYLPQRVILHTHATAMLALADLPEAETVAAEIFEGRVATVPFHMPGFALARAAAEARDAHPEVEGLLLLKHGHFAFADDAETAYRRIIDQTNRVEDWFRQRRGAPAPAPTGTRAALDAPIAALLPVLRGTLGSLSADHARNPDAPMPVLDLRNGDNAMGFLARPDLEALAARGVATPDHAIRTKNRPLMITRSQIAGGGAALAEAVAAYAAGYRRYFSENAARAPEPKTMLDPGPRVFWIEGAGIVGAGADARAASTAADLAEITLQAMTLGEDCGGYHPVTGDRLFEMEYWSLEQAKLGQAAAPAMRGRIVLITGGAGAIGRATATAFAAQGADIFLVDRDGGALKDALGTLGAEHDGLACDLTAPGAAAEAVAACVRRFGGLDILVSNAGAAWTGEMASLSETDLRASFELNFFAHQAMAQAATAIFRAQNRGGQMLFNVSKQAVNPGKGFGAYGLPKAATMFLVRQLALELGADGVRVNGVNADRIRSGLLDDAMISARAAARAVDEARYMAGNLIGREVEPRHVADAFVALARAERTTAHVMTVDGGNIAAALR